MPSSAMMARPLTAPAPVISSSRPARPGTSAPSSAQPGACPPPASPHAAQGRRRAGDQGQLLPDLLVQGGDLGADRVDQPQVHRGLERVDVTEPAGQGLGELGPGGPRPLVAQRGQRGRGAFPGDQGIEEPAAAGTGQVRDHHRDLQQRVFQDLLHPGPGLVLGQPGPGPGQRPQVPDRLRRHERPAQHPPLVQLAQPHAVGLAALAPPGQVPDVADQLHLQPGRLAQVVPHTPVAAGGLQHQPLDALAPQPVHQRGHRRERGRHRPGLLPPAIRPRPRNPGAHHPGPLRHVDRSRVLHHLRAVLGHLRRAAARSTGAACHALIRGHRRLAFPRKTSRTRLPGGGAGTPDSDRRA